MENYLKCAIITFFLSFIPTGPAAAQNSSEQDLPRKNFELLIPKQVNNWKRIQYQYTNFSQIPLRPSVTAYYTRSNFPYKIKLKIAYTKDEQRAMEKNIQLTSEKFGQDAVQTTENGNISIHYFKGHKENKGFAGVAANSGTMTVLLSPNEAIESSEIDAVMNQLKVIFKGLDIKQLTDFYTPPIPDISVADAPQGFAKYSNFLGDTQLAFAYPKNWSVLDFFNKISHERNSVILIKNFKADSDSGDTDVIIKNILVGLPDSQNIFISIKRHRKGYPTEGYTEKSKEQIKKIFPGKFKNLTLEPPVKTELAGYLTFESGMRGDTKTKAMIMQQFVLNIPEKAVYVINILRPEEISKSTKNAISSFLDSIIIRPR